MPHGISNDGTGSSFPSVDESEGSEPEQVVFGDERVEDLYPTVTNGELMAWLAEHNGKLNNELRGMMATANDRIALAEDLANAKSKIGAHLNKPAMIAAAQDVIAKYAGTPYEAEVRKVMEPVISGIQHRINAYSGQPVPDDKVTQLTGDIQAMIDGIQKQDQLDMIAIQDLTSRIRENTQLVSNMISSINQTTMSIVGNVGRA